ncbi:unnamed protein product [Peniophora sp. CBMAI 1063]|nr:unnamed protein product [Peniophora sp. CBMAI 1063]
MAHLNAIPEPRVFNTANNPKEPPLSLKSVYSSGLLHKPSKTTFHPILSKTVKLAERLGVSGTAETLRGLDSAINRPEASIREVTLDVDRGYVRQQAPPHYAYPPSTFRDNHFIEEEFIEGYMPDGTSFGEEMDLDDEIVQSAGFQSRKGKGKAGHSSIIAWGTILLSMQDFQGRSTTVCIGPVGHVPGLADRLLALGQFLHQGMTVEGNAIQIRLIHDGKIYLRFDANPTRSNYYILPALSAHAKSIQYELVHALDYEIMHRRMGHTLRDILRQMRKNTVGFPEDINIPDENPVCSGCVEGKTPAREFPAREERADNTFDLIHSDLKEFSILSYTKFRYTVVFIDDHTSYAWVTLLKKKSDVLNTAKDFLTMVRSKFKTKLQSWRSDQGGKLIGNLNLAANKFLQMLCNKGIEVIAGARHTHQQNGRAERFIRTMSEKGEALRFQASCPHFWWEFSNQHAVHLYNRMPVRCLKWLTPYEMLFGEAPRIDKLQVFGCGAYIYIPKEIRKNTQSLKAELMIYIGVTPGNLNNWLFMRLPNHILFTSTQAIFDEKLFPHDKEQMAWHPLPASLPVPK